MGVGLGFTQGGSFTIDISCDCFIRHMNHGSYKYNNYYFVQYMLQLHPYNPRLLELDRERNQKRIGI